MKLLLLLPLLFTSCATVIYDGNGQKLAVIRSDARDVTLTKSGNGEITFAASAIDNSTPTKAVGSVIKTGIAAWGAAALMKAADEPINAITGHHLNNP